MKIQIRRKNNNNQFPETNTTGPGEPILTTRTVGSSNPDAMYIRSLDGNSWKGIAMTAFTPGYEAGSSTTVSPFSQYILVFCTQQQYDDLAIKDENTFYFITE